MTMTFLANIYNRFLHFIFQGNSIKFIVSGNCAHDFIYTFLQEIIWYFFIIIIYWRNFIWLETIPCFNSIFPLFIPFGRKSDFADISPANTAIHFSVTVFSSCYLNAYIFTAKRTRL